MHVLHVYHSRPPRAYSVFILMLFICLLAMLSPKHLGYGQDLRTADLASPHQVLGAFCPLPQTCICFSRRSDAGPPLKHSNNATILCTLSVFSHLFRCDIPHYVSYYSLVSNDSVWTPSMNSNFDRG
ncbi:hypothetical protein CPB85DRAFT_182820 [Mucidula mucida]|nr:hypothetical protein CPB85DRAFT_182820 [Mucidula mucida]